MIRPVLFLITFCIYALNWLLPSYAHKNSPVAYLTHEDAVDKAREMGFGVMSVLSPHRDKPLIAGNFETFKFQYRVGKTPIETGGFLRLSMRHVFHWSIPQVNKPKAAGLVSASGPKGVTLKIVPWQGRKDGYDLFLATFPWQHAIEVRVLSGRLNPGDEIILIYGDTAHAGPGAQVQPSEANSYIFRTYVAPTSKSIALPLEQDIQFRIQGRSIQRLTFVATSTVPKLGQIRFTIRAEDEFGNLASDYDGQINILSEKGQVIKTVKLISDQQGIARGEIRAPETSGIYRFKITDGHFSARSNPVAVGDTVYAKNIFFGDLHGHSIESDGHGTPDEFYQYCRDVAVLDVCVLTDHGFMITDKGWKRIIKATDRYYAPGTFVTFRAYEWSGVEAVGGDHNVYFRSTKSPIYRSRSYYDYRNQQAYHGNKPQLNFIEDLYSQLRSEFKAGDVMTIPHFGGRKANPNWHDPLLEKNIEIFSEHRRSHNWAYGFIQRGYQLGFIGSSDNHTGRPGYGFLHNPLLKNRPLEIGTALTAIMAKKLNRDEIFNSLLNREVYATTGERILLSFKVGETLMGGTQSATVPPTFTINAEGTSLIKKIEIYKNGRVVHSLDYDDDSFSLFWRDRLPLVKKQNTAYWVRIIQNNGEEAISSPLWISSE